MTPSAPTRRAVILLIVGASLACEQVPTAPAKHLSNQLAPVIQLAPVPRPIDIRSEEAGFFALADSIPGFGGYAFDDNGDLVAFIRNRTPLGDVSAHRFLAPLLARRRAGLLRQTGRVRVRDAAFTFVELAAWRDHFTDSLLGRGLGVRSTDVDEARNRIVIEVASAAGRAKVIQLALHLGVPSNAIVIEDDEVIEFEADVSSLVGAASANGEHYGGMQILRLRPQGDYAKCTLGIYATLGGVTVGVSNSHCSLDRDSKGGDGSLYYNSALVFLGSESHDRNHYDWCPTLVSWVRYCRGADAMLFTVSATSPTPTLAKIARYTLLNPGSDTTPVYRNIDPTNPIIIASRFATRSGEIVNKAGVSTGWTQGTVTATCKDVEMWVWPLILSGPVYRCQHEANYGRAGGDSGAPVFSMVAGYADLKGIHWGHKLQSSSFTLLSGRKTVFSPLSGIEADFGPLGGIPSGSGGSSSSPLDPGCDPVTAIIPC